MLDIMKHVKPIKSFPDNFINKFQQLPNDQPKHDHEWPA